MSSSSRRRTVSTDAFFDPALSRTPASVPDGQGWGRRAAAQAVDVTDQAWLQDQPAGLRGLVEQSPPGVAGGDDGSRWTGGPARSQPGSVPVPERGGLLPHRPAAREALVWWVGVHGGAGETTLAALLPGSAPAGHAWPVDVTGAAPQVVLVARTSMTGLAAAQRAAASWAAGYTPEVDLIGLVLLADAPGRLPAGLRDFARVVAGGAPRTWSLPWVEAWRLGAHPAAVPVPRPVRTLLDDVNALTAR